MKDFFFFYIKFINFDFLRMNTDIISDEESDDFTDEEEEQLATPTVTRPELISDDQLYNSTKQESDTSNNSQWYIDIPKNDYFESSYGNVLK
jgi:hypothetical protein